MTDQPPTDQIRQLVGNLLIGAGILWIALSGICSVGIMGVYLMEEPSFQDAQSNLFVVVVVGGISAALGYIAIVIGRIVRPKK